MKGLSFQERTVILKAMAVLVSCILVACGSGGGGLDLGNNNSGGCDTRPVSGNIANGQQVPSRDGKATVTNSGILVASVTISVDCGGPSGQIGHGYVVEISQSGPVLTVSYRDVPLNGVAESTLQLGEYDSFTGWEAEPAAVRNDTLDEFTLDLALPLERYAIFSLSGGGGGGDETAPSQPNNVLLSRSNTTITVQWSASQDNVGGTGVKGYDVFRGDGPDAELSLIQITPSSPGSITGTSYTDTGLSSTARYCYAVRAVDNAGNTSSLSTPACTSTS